MRQIFGRAEVKNLKQANHLAVYYSTE